MSPVPALLALSLLATSSAAPPREGEPESAAEPPARAASEHLASGDRSTWFALPVLFWLPETRLGFGGTGGFHFHVGEAARPSSAFVAAVYTLERQGSIDVAGDLTLPNGAFASGRIRAVHFPDVFFGLGPDSREADEEPFTRRSVEGFLATEVPVRGSPIRVGPRLEWKAEEIGDLDPGGALAAGGIPGAHGFNGFGMGLGLSRDTRDRAFWPSRGSFVQGWWVFYPPAISRNEGFGRGLAEGRSFLPLGGGRTLGLAAIAEWTHNTPPLTMLPRLGSTRFLRGYREGRYRDRLGWAAQAELRTPLAGRLSGTVFAALGDVAPRVGALFDAAPKVAGGVGLRWRLTGQGANVRLDLAVSEAGPELYVLVLEAF